MRTITFSTKVSFSGITGFAKWEGDRRIMQNSSLRNLINADQILNESSNVQKEKTSRTMSSAQQRKMRKTAGKLAYYSATRKFENKKTGKKYNFKVAFLTLTAPASTQPEQFLAAFENFLSYLRRTANCVYIWKKELGEKGNKFHVHLLINNFIPYYIVSWKWQRLLMAEGIKWPINDKGKFTNAHTRIEIPHSKRQVNYYISKYMSKGNELPVEFGFIWGFSDLLKHCEEIVLDEGDYNKNEIHYLKKLYKVIEHDFFSHICCDPARIKKIAPDLYAEFRQRALEISYTVSLPQKFNYIE